MLSVRAAIPSRYPAVPRNLFETLPIYSAYTPPELGGMFADEFFRGILSPENIDEHTLPIGPARASYSFDEEFTPDELRMALQMWRRRSAPEEDRIT